jgi:hypothetical protein
MEKTSANRGECSNQHDRPGSCPGSYIIPRSKCRGINQAFFSAERQARASDRGNYPHTKRRLMWKSEPSALNRSCSLGEFGKSKLLHVSRCNTNDLISSKLLQHARSLGIHDDLFPSSIIKKNDICRTHDIGTSGSSSLLGAGVTMSGTQPSQGKGEVAAPTCQDDGCGPFSSPAHNEAAMPASFSDVSALTENETLLSIMSKSMPFKPPPDCGHSRPIRFVSSSPNAYNPGVEPSSMRIDSSLELRDTGILFQGKLNICRIRQIIYEWSDECREWKQSTIEQRERERDKYRKRSYSDCAFFEPPEAIEVSCDEDPFAHLCDGEPFCEDHYKGFDSP